MEDGRGGDGAVVPDASAMMNAPQMANEVAQIPGQLISYAQNFEDVLLNRVFGGKQTGFYIDIGAYKPVEGSVTKLFYDRGWSGINIEPGSVFDELQAARPRDINLRMAVLDYTGEVAFFENPRDRGTSHVAEEVDATAVTVPCDTLERIVQSYSNGRVIDFLKVDAEGAEATIVRSTNWRNLRPPVMLFEATRPWSTTLANDEWEPLLQEQGYTRVFFDGINCYYVPDELVTSLAPHFAAPVNVLDRVIKADQAFREQTLAHQNNKLREEVASAERTASELGNQSTTATERVRELASQVHEARATADSLRQRLEHAQAELIMLRNQVEQEPVAHEASREDALRRRLEHTEAELIMLRNQVEQEHLAHDAPPEEARKLQSGSGVGLHPSGFRAKLAQAAKRVAWGSYRVVRPIVRPIAWRSRSFFNGPVIHAIQQTRDDPRPVSARELALGTGTQVLAELLRLQEVQAAELARMAKGVESALLTITLEAASRTEDSGAVVSAAPGLAIAWLSLPQGREAEFIYSRSDMSVGGQIAASGEWEPHVRRWLERTVKPDWTCLDVGANIGAHTLSLASLAYMGQVIGFEADPANHALLARNLAALGGAVANTDTVNLALWDEPGQLLLGRVDEFTGCSFVDAGALDEAGVERRLRDVVNLGAITDRILHTRTCEVEAGTLDTWVDGKALQRIDLIKMDTEGAELRILSGAKGVLKRYRPLLLVEYNPHCAFTHFGEEADKLYRALVETCDTVGALEPDGTVTTIDDWSDLKAKLECGKGRENLVCGFT
ncbi:FkbM family methyltransferase [Aurantimonas sp. NFXS3]|uniref:FkbM family methyltransferase n=1 Tax=Aurantimonas sp. NFXS3 TaxID=2818434 RepID=UPI003B8BB611